MLRLGLWIAANLISLDISSMTESSCWYLVWLAGSSAPFVAGSWDSEGVAVGVAGCGGRLRLRSEPWPALCAGLLGVADRELAKSLRPPPPLTLVRLVPAAARSCCWAGVRPDTPPPDPAMDWELELRNTVIRSNM